MNIYTILKINNDIKENQWKYAKTYLQDEREELTIEETEFSSKDFFISKNYPYIFKGDQILCLPEKVETVEEKYKRIKNEINQKAYQDIIEAYPEWKQINIIRNKDNSLEEKALFDEMSNFIDNIRKNSNEEIEKLVKGAD